MTRFKFTLAALIVAVAGWLSTAASALEPSIVTTVVQARYSDVVDGLTAAIGAEGGHIAHVVPVRQVLAASEARFGADGPRFAQAETLEFCNARLSHALIQHDPDYLVLCPFAISVYQLTGQPGRVHLSYRNPRRIVDDADVPVLNAVGDYLDAIVRNATQWFQRLEPAPRER